MITGMHAIVFSEKAEQVRAFFRDVLGFPHVDAGHGWLIFAAPPSELAVHPSEGDAHVELYLMCDDLERTLADLKAKDVEPVRPVTRERWGAVTAIALPDGAHIGLYQPLHPLPPR
jgi:predicted enzyme related to lactoylglutathione lyase